MHTSDIAVIRRDGTKTTLNINKIRSVIEWACKGLSVNSIALEAGLTTRLKDNITTREIQDNLISCALEMCNPNEPDWRYVAGRLHIWGHRKDTKVNRNFGAYYDDLIFDNPACTDLSGYISCQVANGIYDERLLAYSTGELIEAESWINPNYDLDFDYAGAVLLTSRYLLSNELPQEALLVCALLLALPENPENRLYWAKQFYESIASRKISLATPILANLRTPNGSLTSCFIVAMEDNLESIFREITNSARISKNGGGVGVNVSRIRATGSSVMNKPNASGGVIPWIKLLNDTAIAVNQGGRRAGAVTVGLDIWHLDIPEFLEIQAENGDQRRKAYDIFPQVIIPDLFMNQLIADGEWTLFDPHEVREVLGFELAELWGDKFEKAYNQCCIAKNSGQLSLTKTVKARELFKSIMRTEIETGMPYLAFKDTINKANPNKHVGYIPGVNLCCESFSNVTPGQEAHCCNLVSLNLANLDWEDIQDVSNVAVRMLDNTIDLTNPPFGDAKRHNNRYRTIGVGCMGLADWLAKKHLNYESLDEIDSLFESIGYWCTHSSMELAKERGAYPAFIGSDWDVNPYNILPGIKERLTTRWDTLLEQIKIHGIRNSHVTAIAPNTSSSLVQGCTASILPVYSRFFYDKWAKGTVPIAPPYIADCFWFYPENKTMDQTKVIKAVATIQKWIDTGISMELLFNLNAGVYFPDEPERSINAKDIFETLVLAWQEGCKAVYYIRTVQKDDFKESNDSCVACAN